MTLDPQVRALIDQFQTQIPADTHLSVDEMRELSKLIYKRNSVEHVAQVLSEAIPGPGGVIPIRIYKPQSRGPLPVLVYFHGGGWVFGSLEISDALCRSFANKAECIVVSVDYRLAPEYFFPAAAEDCYAAVKWVSENATSFGGDPLSIAVGGDSAGGNLAASVCLMARDQMLPKIICQLLIYPIISPNFDSPTYLEYGKGFLFDREKLIWCWDLYAPDTIDRRNPYLSPIYSTGLQNLPPAIIVTAEFDPLRHEGEAYAKRLREAEVSVIFKRFNGMIHGFLNWDESIDQAKKAIIEISDALKLILSLGANV